MSPDEKQIRLLMENNHALWTDARRLRSLLEAERAKVAALEARVETLRAAAEAGLEWATFASRDGDGAARLDCILIRAALEAP